MTPFSKLGSWTGPKETMSWAFISASRLCVQHERMPSAAVTSHQVSGTAPSNSEQTFPSHVASAGCSVTATQKETNAEANSSELTSRQRQGWAFSGYLGLSSSPSRFKLLVATGLAWLVASVITTIPPLNKDLAGILALPGSPAYPWPSF